MFKARIVFEKTGKAALISHLDLMKCFQRAFIRAGVPVRYSQGFNPHIYLSVLLPLSLGYEGSYEIADFDVEADALQNDIVTRLNAALPEGIFVKKAGQAVTPVSDVAFSRFELTFRTDESKISEFDFISQSVTKRSKRGERTVPVSDYVYSAEWKKSSGGIVCNLLMKAGEEQLNPSAIVRVLSENGVLSEDITVKYKRTGFYNKKMELFF